MTRWQHATLTRQWFAGIAEPATQWNESGEDVPLPSGGNVVRLLNNAGVNGWELVGAQQAEDFAIYYFKRPWE